jgi:hypothetical protein
MQPNSFSWTAKDQGSRAAPLLPSLNKPHIWRRVVPCQLLLRTLRQHCEIIIAMLTSSGTCPLCGESSAVRPRLLLIDERWVPAPGKDPRLAYFADLRVDDVQTQNVHEHPLEQFIDGFYCDRCNKGFVSEQVLNEGRRRYR